MWVLSYGEGHVTDSEVKPHKVREWWDARDQEEPAV